jgi:hypothetical protein
VDNSGVISLIQNPVDHAANKHIRLSCHYTRELTEEKVIAPQRVPSEKNLADMLTKPFGVTAFKAVLRHYVQECPDRGGVLTSRASVN